MTEYFTAFEDALAEGLTAGMYLRTPSLLLSLVAYVLTAISLFSMAKRRGIHHAWLSWIPVGNTWVLGALSDHYRYVARGEAKIKRKVLLTLELVILALAFITLIVCGVVIIRLINMYLNDAGFADFTELGIQLVILLCMVVPMAIVSVVYTIFYILAMFDIFASADPRNRWLYLILSLLSTYAAPLILFFNRKRDDGMPPRIPEPVYQPPVYQPEQPTYQPEQPVCQPEQPEPETFQSLEF